MTTSALPRTAPLALWRVAEAFLHMLHSLFGAPEDVARAHTLTRAAHALLVSWLRVGEALLRRLIAIEAAAFERRPSAPPASSRRAKRTRRLIAFSADNPEDWRVSFRLTAVAERRLPAGPHTGARQASAPKHNRFPSAWPLAERYEALIRVFNAPHAYARRLAQRLHARPRLLSAVLHEPAHYADRVDGAEELSAAAARAWRRSDSS